jgi:hypothetical protein
MGKASRPKMGFQKSFLDFENSFSSVSRDVSRARKVEKELKKLENWARTGQ